MEALDELAVETIGSINDGSVLGAVCVLLIALLVFREGFYWPKQIKKLEDENSRCHEAHDKTRTALLEEVRAGGQTLVLMRDQMKAQQHAVDALLRMASDYAQDRRRGQRDSA